MRRALALLTLALAAPAAALARSPGELPGLEDLPEPPRYIAGYLAAGGGWAIPFGGHWGDRDDGFKPSQVYSLAASRRVDEIVSYGLESSYSLKHRARKLDGLDLRIFSLTPFVKASFPEGNAILYGVLGAGVYQWSQPAFTAAGVRYASDSGSSAGINLGGGISYPFWWGTRAGLDLRWHHIINMKGSAFKLDSADNFNVMLVVSYGVWKTRKTSVPSTP